VTLTYIRRFSSKLSVLSPNLITAMKINIKIVHIHCIANLCGIGCDVCTVPKGRSRQLTATAEDRRIKAVDAEKACS